MHRDKYAAGVEGNDASSYQTTVFEGASTSGVRGCVPTENGFWRILSSKNTSVG